jgi:hypothetical protein
VCFKTGQEGTSGWKHESIVAEKSPEGKEAVRLKPGSICSLYGTA